MDLRFNTSLAEGYKSGSQIARVLTEDWLARNEWYHYLATLHPKELIHEGTWLHVAI